MYLIRCTKYLSNLWAVCYVPAVLCLGAASSNPLLALTGEYLARARYLLNTGQLTHVPFAIATRTPRLIGQVCHYRPSPDIAAAANARSRLR